LFNQPRHSSQLADVQKIVNVSMFDLVLILARSHDRSLFVCFSLYLSFFFFFFSDAGFHFHLELLFQDLLFFFKRFIVSESSTPTDHRYIGFGRRISISDFIFMGIVDS
jgi:hypothetical protein